MAAVVVTEPVTSGVVVLKTTFGDVLIELWAREAPKAVRNFIQLGLEGYYDGCIFHRVVPGFIAQTGDDTGTGQGGESIYDEGEFIDEFSQRLKFNRRGLVGMANQGRRDSNLSQFFFTLDRADELNSRNTLFGRVVGDTLFNVLKLNEVELEPGTEKPVYPPKIRSFEVRDNPFEDIVPRITAQERREQERAKKEMKIERAKEREQSKRKGTKNKALLSFGAEPEEPVDENLTKTKFKSAHDALEDSRLSKRVMDDRGTSATLPPELAGPPKRARLDDVAQKSSRSKPVEPTITLEKARAAKAKAEPSAADKVRDEIAKVESDLKKMSRRDSDDDDGVEKGKNKKVKRSGPSLLQLEREKYANARGGKKTRGNDEDDTLDVLNSFRSKLYQAGDDDEEEDQTEKKPSAAEEALGIEQDGDSDENDAGWLSHRLKFRKDATLDQHSIEEYAVLDPLAKTDKSLAEMQDRADRRSRVYAGDRPDESRPGGSRRHGDDRRRDDQRGSRGGRDGGGRNLARPLSDRRRDDDRQRERPRYEDDRREDGRSRRNDWKNDRVSTANLA
ncbi:Peptidyl-prolyl isomerase cwc27 [Microbotryomycetes sp. JL221]|nr:Peptidyl-prolyl isomerase cwc27 [Microbotryomycetes sp. JL221]